MTDHQPPKNRAGREQGRGFFLHSLFQQRLPQDRHIQLPLLARLINLRQLRRLGLAAWYLLAIGLAGWLGFTYVQNVRVLENGPIPSKEMVTEAGFTDPLPELQKLHDSIIEAEQKNRTLIISRFGFDQSKAYEEQLKTRFADLFGQTLLRMEPIALGYWRQNLNHFSARQKQLYAQFLLGQWQINSNRIKNDTQSLQQYARLTDPLWSLLFPKAAQIPVGPLYLAYQRWQGIALPTPLAADYSQAMTDLLSRIRSQEADWLWAAPAVSAEAVAIEDFWIDFPQAGWIEVPGGLTLQGRTEAESFLNQILLPLAQGDAKKTQDLFWQNYWQQFFTAWERFTSELLEQGRILSESPGNIVAAGPVLRQDGPYWRLFTRFADEMKGLPDSQNRPAWVRQWQILSTAWDSFILQQNRKTGGVTDKISALATQVVHSGEELAGQRINLAVSTREQLAQLFASYLADLAALSPVTVSREDRVDQFGRFFRGLQQGETSTFYTAYADYRKLVSLESDGAEDTLSSRLIFAPLAFIAQVALGEATTILQQNWTETVIAPLGTGHTANQMGQLFSQADSPVPKFIAGPAAPFLEASTSGYRPRKGYGMSLPFRPDFLAFLFNGTRASKNTFKSFTVTLATRPMNVNSESTIHPFASKISLQCADKEFVLDNWNYASQAEFTWSPASCGDVVLSLQFPAGISLNKRYAGPLGFPKFLNDFSDGSQTFALSDFSGDSGPLKEQKLSTVTLAYRVSGAPDVRSWLTSVPPTIPQEIFNQPSVQASMPPIADRRSEQLSALDQESDTIFIIPRPLLRNYFLGLKSPEPQPTGQPLLPGDTGEDWIRQQSPQTFTIQLLSQRSSRSLDDLIVKYPALELHWYRTTGKRWYVLISGAFPTKEEALEARKRLPTELSRYAPLIKSFATVQAELGPAVPPAKPTQHQ
nr:SPOR domain-containing protein [uncultured Desulfobulbus sp.]